MCTFTTLFKIQTPTSGHIVLPTLSTSCIVGPTQWIWPTLATGDSLHVQLLVTIVYTGVLLVNLAQVKGLKCLAETLGLLPHRAGSAWRLVNWLTVQI